jgi:diguanylate cyclase (GGDEF)-like protein
MAVNPRYVAVAIAIAIAAMGAAGVSAEGRDVSRRNPSAQTAPQEQVVRASGVLPRTANGAVPNPATIQISPRRAAALGAVVACCLLLLQYAHRPKTFILLWAAGWLLIAPAMLLTARSYSSPTVARSAVGLSQFLLICTSTLFLWSADIYRQTHYLDPKRLRAILPFAVWFFVAPLIFGVGAVLIPGYAISAAVLVGAGSMYVAVLLERRMIGAGLIAFVLFGLAVSNVTTAFATSRILATSQFPFEILVLNAVLYTLGALGIHQLIFEDMTYELQAINRRLEATREELVQAAITDPLTACHNRRFFDRVIDRELQRHDRFALPLSLLFIDIDRFKAVNDALGHEAGDRVLQYVARFLKRHIREADYVFRWGGDEFLVMITCRGDDAQHKAAALKASFDAAPEAVDLPPGIGLSVGWTEVPNGTTDVMPLVHQADQRMYENKGSRGGGGI